MNLPKPLSNNIVSKRKQSLPTLKKQPDAENSENILVLSDFDLDEALKIYSIGVLPYMVTGVFESDQLSEVHTIACRLCSEFDTFLSQSPSYQGLRETEEDLIDGTGNELLQHAQRCGPELLADLYVAVSERVRKPLFVKEKLLWFFSEEENELYGVVGVLWVIFLLHGMQIKTESPDFMDWIVPAADSE